MEGTVTDENGLVPENLVQVRLIMADGTEGGKQLIDENGQYKFLMPPEGEQYTVEFTYGINKYNWQDYEVDSSSSDVSENTSVGIRKDQANTPIDKNLWEKYQNILSSGSINDILTGGAYENYAVIAEDTFTAGNTNKTVNMKLKPREDIQLKVNKELIRAKITLSDGSVLREENYENDPQEDVPAYWYIDDEIMHGATIQLEYKITIESNTDLSEIKTLDYLSYDNSTLAFDQKAKMLTDSGKENDDWNLTDKDKVKELTGLELDEGKIYLLSENGNIDTSVTNQLELHLIVSKLVTPSDEDLTYDNVVEVVSYKNPQGRIAKESGSYIIPGNYDPKHNTNKDADTDNAKQFIVTKPTGGKPKE